MRELGVRKEEGAFSVGAGHCDVLVDGESNEGHGDGDHEEGDELGQVDEGPLVVQVGLGAAASEALTAEGIL